MFRVAVVFLFFGLLSVADASKTTCHLEIIHYEQINRHLNPSNLAKLPAFGLQDAQLNELGDRLVYLREGDHFGHFELVDRRQQTTTKIGYRPDPHDEAKLTHDGKVLIQGLHKIVLCNSDGECQTIITVDERITAAELLNDDRVLVGTERGRVLLVSAMQRETLLNRGEEILSFSPITDGDRILVTCKTALYVLNLNNKTSSGPNLLVLARTPQGLPTRFGFLWDFSPTPPIISQSGRIAILSAETYDESRSVILVAGLANGTLTLLSEELANIRRQNIPIQIIGTEDKPQIVYLEYGDNLPPNVVFKRLNDGKTEFYPLDHPALSQLALQGALAVSTDGRYVALASERAEVIVLDRQMRTLNVIQFGYGHQNVQRLRFSEETLRGVNAEGEIFEVNVNPSRP